MYMLFATSLSAQAVYLKDLVVFFRYGFLLYSNDVFKEVSTLLGSLVCISNAPLDGILV